MDKLLLTPIEAAEALSISRSKLYELLAPDTCSLYGSMHAGGSR